MPEARDRAGVAMARLKFDESCLAAVAAELETTFSVEPYRVRGASVYRAIVPSGPRLELRLLLWPSIGRVDAYLASATLILKGVDRVDIYPGVEVTFRRNGGGFLFATRSGQAYMAV